MKTKLLSLVAMAAMTASVMPAVAQHLTGAGGTFPNPIYQRGSRSTAQSHPGVQINYQSVGSGAGIRQISQGIVDFGASDGPMTDKQLADVQAEAAAYSDGAGCRRAGLQPSGRDRGAEVLR